MQYLFNEWRRLHSEQLYALYTSSNIIQVIKPRTMRSAGHVACVETEEERTGFWWGDLREIDNLEDLSVDRRIILKRISNKVRWGGMDWIALAQDRDRWR
jgi:hypothetical protein